VRIALEQSLDLVEVRAREVPSGREHGAHPYADELVVGLREDRRYVPDSVRARSASSGAYGLAEKD